MIATTTTLKERLEEQIAEERRREALIRRYLYAVAQACVGANGEERGDPAANFTWDEQAAVLKRGTKPSSAITLAVPCFYEVAGVRLQITVRVFAEREAAIYGPDLELCDEAAIVTQVSVEIGVAQGERRLCSFDIGSPRRGLIIDAVATCLDNEEGERYGAVGIAPQASGDTGLCVLDGEAVSFAEERIAFIAAFPKQLERCLIAELFPTS